LLQTFLTYYLQRIRYFSTGLRRFYHVSRFVNWDHAQAFHIRISIVAIVLASLHAIGHLTGSFVWGSRAENQEGVAGVLGPSPVPWRYQDYVATIPGFTGVTARK
jgi:dual oxidase